MDGEGIDSRMEAMFAAHFAAVRAYCLRRLPVSEANDVVSEVFIVAWKKIDDLPEGDGELPYLYGIARNKIAHARRRHAQYRRLVSRAADAVVVEAPDPETVVVLRSEHDALGRALLALRRADREVIRLRAWEELTAPEIAEVLGISVSAAEKRIARAQQRLASAVRRRETNPRPHASLEGGER